ncbi:MAG TPA: YihY/virulence factor BrkB family protein [Vicinamibacterales bacterium]
MGTKLVRTSSWWRWGISRHARAFGGVLRRAWVEYERDYARYFAVAMVYYALISLVPFLLLLLGVIGLLLQFSDFAGALEQQLLDAVQTNFGMPLRMLLNQMLEQVQRGSVVATIISLAGLFVTASTLVAHLRLTFRAIWKHAPPIVSGTLLVVLRATFLEKATAFLIVILGGAFFLTALVLMAGIQWATRYFSALPLVDSAAGIFVGLAGPIIIVALTFALLFLALPPVRLKWRHVWLATAFSTAGWIISAEALVFFGGVLGQGRGAPGAFGSVLALMLWINVVCQLLFYGAELCKVVYADVTSATPRSPT